MVHTHELTFAGAVLTKRYVSWSRGEHHREWAVLRVAHRYAPDLVPVPLSARLDAEPPMITMSRLPGEPLGGPLTSRQLAALVAAITRLWSVPLDGDERWPGEAEPWADDLAFARRLTDGPRPAAGLTRDAYDAAVAWWNGSDPQLLRARPAELILGHRDSNLANYLYDGDRVRIVDFEDAGASDPANEIAILAEHMSARDIDVSDLLAHFPAVDERRLRAARRVWAMFWLRLLLPGGPAVRRNPPGTAERQAARLLTLLA